MKSSLFQRIVSSTLVLALFATSIGTSVRAANAEAINDASDEFENAPLYDSEELVEAIRNQHGVDVEAIAKSTEEENDLLLAEFETSEESVEAASVPTSIEADSEIVFSEVNVNGNPRLKILGAGFKKRRQRELITLACTDPTCAVFQFYSLKNDDAPVPIGDAIKAPKTANPKLYRKAVRLLVKKYMAFHQTQKAGFVRGEIIQKIESGILGIGIFLALAAKELAWSGGTIFGWTLLVFYVSVYLLESPHFANNFIGHSKVSASLTDQDRWSWASDAKKIGKNKFNRLYAQIDSGRYQNLAKEDKKHLSAYYKRHEKRLLKKGVIFADQDWK